MENEWFDVIVRDDVSLVDCHYFLDISPGAILTVCENVEGYVLRNDVYILNDNHGNTWVKKEHVTLVPAEPCIGGE